MLSLTDEEIELQREFMMLVTAMIIVMMKNLMSESYIAMLWYLMMLVIFAIIMFMMIIIMINLTPESFIIHVDNDDDEEFNGIKFHGVSKNYGRVRDHCYYTGKYIGTAHSICNLRYKTPKEIPAVFHNQ